MRAGSTTVIRENTLLTLTERVDGASILSPGHKWAGFPSAAAFPGGSVTRNSWRLRHRLSNLKLRVSYGITGNSGIQPYGTQSYLLNQSMGFENTPAPAYIFNTIIGNANLKLELSKTTDIGVDMGFFKGRINASVDVYNTNTLGYPAAEEPAVEPGCGLLLSECGHHRRTGASRSR